MKTRIPTHLLRRILTSLANVIQKITSSPKTISNYWRGSKAQYDAIVTKDSDTLYFTEEVKVRNVENDEFRVFTNSDPGRLISDIHFNGDGTKLFIHWGQADSGGSFFRSNTFLTEYNLSTPYDVSTATASGNELTWDNFDQSSATFNVIHHSLFSDDGMRLYFSDSQGVSTIDNGVFCLTLTAPWDITNPTQEIGNQLTHQEGGAFAIAPGGARAIMISQGALTEYILSTPYRLDTATRGVTRSKSSLGTNPSSAGISAVMRYSADGRKLYVKVQGVIYELNLATPFDFSSYQSNNGPLSMGSNTGNSTAGFTFGEDGNTIIAAVYSGTYPNYTGFLNKWNLILPYAITETSALDTELYLGNSQIGA